MKLTNSAVPVYTVAGTSSSTTSIADWVKNKRRKKGHDDPSHIELLQDFAFEEASHCVRVSDDGDWVMSTGTYKPQIHTHYLPNLALSWARHTDTINKTFLLLDRDYSKSVHLQEDRSLEFHTPGGKHHGLRIPRYGRDLIYDRSGGELFVPAVGVDSQSGMGSVFRVNLELGRFMNEFEVDVGGDDFTSAGAGALQGGIGVGAVNTGAVADESHGLLAFGTTLGTVEYWDPRVRTRVATLMLPAEWNQRPGVTALTFHREGIRSAVGTESGLVYIYDLRSPVPTLKKDQGYDYPIQHVQFLTSGSTTKATSGSESKVLSGDKRILKIWEERDGTPWTSVEPDVDINCVAWCPDSGMILTANEGAQQHAFLIPQLGPAPKWCAFLDNVVEEMADDPNDPNAYSSRKSGEVYDNFKFLTLAQLRTLNMDHLIGKTNLLRPYMHGYFVAQKLYEEARLIANPTSYEEERAKRVQQKIDKERESRIRGQKKVTAKVNRKLAERILEREALNERRRAQRVLAQGGDEKEADQPTIQTPEEKGLLGDSRFAKMFEQDDFVVDESSREFQSINPSTKTAPRSNLDQERGLTAVEEDMIDEVPNSSDDGSESDDYYSNRRETGKAERLSTADYKRRPDKKKKKSHQNGGAMSMQVSSSTAGQKGLGRQQQDRSFGDRAATFKSAPKEKRFGGVGVVGEKTITFDPTPKRRSKQSFDVAPSQRPTSDRRSASRNKFRGM